LKVTEENVGYRIFVASERCAGHACLKCQTECPAKVFRFESLEIKEDKEAEASLSTMKSQTKKP
jgi:ferredoxin